MLNILKASYALSEEPLYINVESVDETLEDILGVAINHLQRIGNFREAQQLAGVSNTHGFFNMGHQIGKTLRFRELRSRIHSLFGKDVNLAEIELIKQHTGDRKSVV